MDGGGACGDGTILEVDEDSIVLLDTTTTTDPADGDKDPIMRNMLAAGDLDTPMKPPPPPRVRHPSAADHMKVYLRIRPLTAEEEERGENQNCMELENDNQLLAHAPKDSHTYKHLHYGMGKQTNKFTFSKIFNEKTSQKEFFNATMLTTVKEFIEGQNCLVFTYGITNSGKTYTIQGSHKDGGVLPRSLDVIFNSIEGKQWGNMTLKPRMFCDVGKLSAEQEAEEVKLKENLLKLATDEEPEVSVMTSMVADSDVSRISDVSTMSTDSLNSTRQSVTSEKHNSLDQTGIQKLFAEAEERVRESISVSVEVQGQIRFSVWISFVEIYNEYIYDLLEPMPKKKNARRVVLNLREDKNGVPYIRGMKEVKVNSADEAYKMLTIGQKNLRMACTKLNHNSSRSHCIFTIKMLRVVDKENPRMARMSMLSFCDLAGSERYTKTQTRGDRIKEAGNINTSLLTLSKCIKALRHNQATKDHPQIVPFRESRLTRIFQSYFSGKGRASMIVNINQCAGMFDETLHALKYSAIAKQVVVVQQPEKPPPEKKKKIETAGRSRSRLVSMALAADNPRSRETIGWATPGTLAKLMEEEEKARNLPLPDCDDSDLDGGVNDREEEMMEIIQGLKAELLEQRQQQLELEQKIRGEVCEEMAAQLVEIEAQYSERLRREQAMLEETAEKRVDLITQSIRRTRKRKRNPDAEEDEGDDMVPSYMLHAEQVKRQDAQARSEDLEAEAATLKEKVENLQSSLKQLCKEKDAAVQERTRLQLDLGDSRHRLEELQGMADAIEELQQLVAESRQAVQAAEDRLMAKEERIRELQCQLSEGTSGTADNDCEDCQELVGRLTEREAELEQQAEQLTKFQQLADMLGCDLDEKSKQLEILQSGDSAAATPSGDDAVLARKQATIDRLEKSVAEYKQVLADNETFIAELNQEVKDLKKSLESATVDLQATSETEDLDVRLQETSNKVKELQDSLDKKVETATALEESLVQANEVVRSKTLEVDQLQQTLNEKTQQVTSLQEDLGQVKEEMLKSHTDLQDQLDDYILKVNEQAEEVGDLQDRFKVKCSDLDILTKKLSEVQEENKKLAATLKEKQDLFAGAGNRVQEIEERMSSERRQARGRGEELEFVLNEKSVLIEQLQSDMSEQAEKLKKSSEANSKLQSKIEEHEKCTHDHEEKMSTLQASLEKAGETGVELDQLKCDLEKAHADLKREKRRADDAAKDLATQAQDGDTQKTASDEQLENARFKITELEKKVDDMEYKHQMSLRQLRREKAQVETLLKEAKESLEEADKKVLESSRSDQETNAHVVKIAKLEDVIRELENCFTSSKEGQATAEQTSEVYRSKCHKLEDQLEVRDEHIQNLEDEMECLKERQEKDSDDLADQLSNAKQTIAESGSDLRRLEEELQELGKQLEDTESSHEKDMEQKVAEITVLTKRLEEQKASMASDEGELQKTLAAAQESLRQKETELCECQTEVDTLRETHKQHQKETEECESHLERAKEQLEAAKDAQEKKTKELVACQSRITELQASVDEKESVIASNTEENQAKISQLTEELSNIQTKLSSRTEQVETLEQSLKNREQEYSVVEQKVAEKESQLTHLELRVQDGGEVSSKKDAEIAELQSKVETLQQTVEKITHQSATVEAKLELQVESYQTQVSELKEGKQKGEEQLQQELTELREGKQKMEEQLQSAQQQLEEQREALQKVEEQLASREVSVESYNKQVTLLNKEIGILTDQNQKNEERMSSLNSQLSESSQGREEQLAKFRKQEEQLRHLEEKSEQEESSAKEVQTKISKLKEEVEELQGEVREKERATRRAEREREGMELQLQQAKEEVERKDQRHQSRVAKMAELKEQLETEKAAHEQALKDMQTNKLVIEELKKSIEDNDSTMTTVDGALQRKNEEIQSLTKELNEETERHQALLQSTQDTRQQLQTLEQQAQEAGGQREAAEDKARELQCAVKDLKREVSRLEREKTRAGEDVRDSNKELKDLEKKLDDKTRELNEMRQEFEHLKSNMEEKLQEVEEVSQKGQAMLVKQKFQNLEVQNKQLKEQLEHAEQKKEQELKKWREDRDKLVSGLEQILKQKDQELMKLKVKREPMPTYGNDQELEQLREEILNKDAIIAELTSQADGPKSNTRSARKPRRARTQPALSASDEDNDGLKREIQNLHRQLGEQEESRKCDLQKVTRAKDSIIDDLKQSNIPVEVKSETKPKAQKRRKRKSSEHEVATAERSEVTPRKSKRTSRAPRSTKKGKLHLVADEENDDPLVSIQEEGVIDLDDVSPRKNIFSSSHDNNTDDDFVVPPSPAHAQKTPAQHRRKRKLRSTAPEVFAASPCLQGVEAGDDHQRDNSHDTVARKLRSRRH